VKGEKQVFMGAEKGESISTRKKNARAEGKEGAAQGHTPP
jgi:hypothetical protein